MTTDLNTMKECAKDSHKVFEAKCAEVGATEWDWYRACESVDKGSDRQYEIDLATNTDIKMAYDEWMQTLHGFYLARDGKHGFLGQFEKGR